MTSNILNFSDIDKVCKIRKNTPSVSFFETFASNRPSICNYSGLSLSRLPSISNIFLSRTKDSVPGTSVWPSGYYSLFISNTLYLEYLLISNKYFGPGKFLSLYLKHSFARAFLHYKKEQKCSIF